MRRDAGAEEVGGVPAGVFAVAESEVVRRLHWSLREGGGPAAGWGPGGPADGPSPGDALHWRYRLEQLAQQARAPYERLRRVCHVYGLERDRDLRQLVRACGAAAQHCAAVVEAELDRAVSPGGVSGVSGLAWAHITCGIRAEAAICAERAAQLTAAHAAAQRLGDACERMKRAQEDARRLSGPAGELGAAVNAVKDARSRRDAWAQHGPGDEVGQAGERYLAEELTDVAEQAFRLYREMAGYRAFRAWRPVADPLYLAWLDGGLRRAVVPPTLYYSRTELYAAYPRLAEGWDLRFREGGVADGGDSFPLGSLERYVRDEAGNEWVIIIATPGRAEDPRAWTEPSAAVIAARAPRSGLDALCYVLAQSVLPRDILPVIHQRKVQGSLEAVAGALSQ